MKSQGKTDFISRNIAGLSGFRGSGSRLTTIAKLLTVVCLGMGTQGMRAIASGAPAGNSAEKSCGPPNYCARTDRRVEPYPKTPPALGAAGSVITDPNFGSRIVRATDARTDANGRSFHTPASSEQNSWNKDSTKFYVGMTGGNTVLFDFSPTTLAVRQVEVLNLGWKGEPQFSYAQPNLLYGTTDKQAEFQQYDVATRKTTKVHDVSSCVKLDAADNAYDISVNADDNRFMAVIGPQQDKNYLVYLYDRDKGCRWYNTQTGEVGGQWGPKGTVSAPYRFGIHNARISKRGDFVVIGGGSNGPRGPVVWEVGSLNASQCSVSPPDSCGGHHAIGYDHMVNPSGRSDPLDILIRPLNKLGSTSPLVPQLPPAAAWMDKHFSWNNADPQDSAPVCFSAYRRDGPKTVGAPLPVERPWDNEILCVQVDGKGSKLWRIAHTFSTATNGFWSTPRGNISPDGRFYMFTSDWENELGTDPKSKGYRTDVFIVELR
jgi:hypothetical protein